MRKLSSARRRIVVPTLCSLAILGFACGGEVSQDDLEVGEAASMLTSSDESGDLAGDAVAGEDAAELESRAEEAALLPQAASGGDGACDFGARRRAVLDRYDANGNRRLDPAERQVLREDLSERGVRPMALRLGVIARHHVFARVRWVFDENGDGSLSSDERTELVAAMEARCERVRAARLERFDANQDGSLDAAERLAAVNAWRARIQTLREQVLTQYDVDSDGRLDASERAAFKADRLAAFQARRAALLAQYDSDGDGTLSADEALPLRQLIQQRIVEGMDAE